MISEFITLNGTINSYWDYQDKDTEQGVIVRIYDL